MKDCGKPKSGKIMLLPGKVLQSKKHDFLWKIYINDARVLIMVIVNGTNCRPQRWMDAGVYIKPQRWQ